MPNRKQYQSAFDACHLNMTHYLFVGTTSSYPNHLGDAVPAHFSESFGYWPYPRLHWHNRFHSSARDRHWVLPCVPGSPHRSSPGRCVSCPWSHSSSRRSYHRTIRRISRTLSSMQYGVVGGYHAELRSSLLLWGCWPFSFGSLFLWSQLCWLGWTTPRRWELAQPSWSSRLVASLRAETSFDQSSAPHSGWWHVLSSSQQPGEWSSWRSARGLCSEGSAFVLIKRIMFDS